MTGKQIANILRKTRRKWGTGAYYNPHTDKYCVLGILASLQGVNESDLYTLHYENMPRCMEKLTTLTWLNDRVDSKAELIKFLEEFHSTTDWPISKFVKWCKTKIRSLK
jgi:hypothetical protein